MPRSLRTSEGRGWAWLVNDRVVLLWGRLGIDWGPWEGEMGGETDLTEEVEGHDLARRSKARDMILGCRPCEIMIWDVAALSQLRSCQPRDIIKAGHG